MWTCGTARLYNGMGKGLYPEGYGPFLFDRKVPFRPNKNTIMRTRAKGVYCLTANALGAGVHQGAHFFVQMYESGIKRGHVYGKKNTLYA